MTCTVVYKPDAETPAVTLTYPSDRFDEVNQRAAERFCGPWTVDTDRRWRALLRADEKRRKAG